MRWCQIYPDPSIFRADCLTRFFFLDLSCICFSVRSTSGYLDSDDINRRQQRLICSISSSIDWMLRPLNDLKRVLASWSFHRVHEDRRRFSRFCTFSGDWNAKEADTPSPSLFPSSSPSLSPSLFPLSFPLPFLLLLSPQGIWKASSQLPQMESLCSGPLVFLELQKELRRQSLSPIQFNPELLYECSKGGRESRLRVKAISNSMSFGTPEELAGARVSSAYTNIAATKRRKRRKRSLHAVACVSPSMYLVIRR